MCLPISIILNDITIKYNLNDLVDKDGWVYMERRKGMYCLKQARKLAHKQLTQHFDPNGYYPCQFTSGLCQHKWRPTIFSLVVDDFGIKYIHIDNAHHIINTFKQWYEISIDLFGSLFCGMSIKWNYHNHTCNISISV